MEAYETYQSNLSYVAALSSGLADVQAELYDGIAENALRVWNESGIEEISAERIAALYLNGDPDTEPWEIVLSDAGLCSPDFARFCKCFQRKLPHWTLWNGLNIAHSLLVTDKDLDVPNGRTAYMQNTYSDRAWKQFSAFYPQMTAEYFSSYAAVCEDVYNGQCQYGILPLHTSSDGLLMSFRKLIAKYDLKICLETRVKLNDDSVTRFVLLQRKLSSPRADIRNSADSETPSMVKLNLSAVLSEDTSIGALTGALEVLGVKINAVHSLTLEYADQTQEFYFEIEMSREELNGFSIFLAASQLRYVVEGIYTTV